MEWRGALPACRLVSFLPYSTHLECVGADDGCWALALVKYLSTERLQYLLEIVMDASK